MDIPRLRISERLRSLMTYEKMAGETPRIVILRSQYWLDGACENAARAMGWQVAAPTVPMEGALRREHSANLLDAIVSTRPDFVLSINLAGMDVDGMWARFFADLRVPYVAWFVDTPRTIIMDRATYGSECAVALTWDESYASYLRNHGFAHVHWLPLAADVSVFNAEPPASSSATAAFVGNSLREFAERAWQPVRNQAELHRIAESAFSEGRVTREAFAGGLADIIGGDQAQNLDAEQRRHLEMLFFLEGTRRLREQWVRALVEDGLEVYGDSGWADITPRVGPALHYFNELPRFYGQCSVNLNFTSVQMPVAVNQRVFDCPAAGGFLLTDAQRDLERLFDADTVATFTTIEECRDKLRYFREHDSARRAMIERSRAQVLRRHTYQHRLRSIAAWVLEHYG